MSDKEFLMALDAGTGAARCVLISSDGKTLHEEYQEWQYEYPEEAQPGGSEFSPQVFWNIFETLIRKTLTKAKIKPAQIKGISSTSQREGIVLLDESGNELYGGPNLDMRAPTNSEQFTKEFAERIHQISGHWPFPMFAPYRLLWFKQHRPEIYEKTACMLLMNDWILFRLCGEKGSEPSNATETLLYNLYKHDWEKDLVREMGLNPDILPAALESGQILGRVTAKVAERTGLLAGTPVVLGGADTQCALLGMGASENGSAGVVLGSFGPIQMVTDKPVIGDPAKAWSGCHVVPQRWVIESTSMEAGQAFRWIRDVFYSSQDTDIYNLMAKEAEESPPGSMGIKAYLGPRLPDYRCLQFNGPGGFVTQLPPTPGTAKRGNFARAALESIGYGVRINLDRLQTLSGIELKTLRACGGLSKSKVLLQILANLNNVNVMVPKIREGSAIGAAICAGVGSGVFNNTAEGIEALIEWDISCEPDQTEKYEELYGLWLQDYQKMYGAHTLRE